MLCTIQQGDKQCGRVIYFAPDYEVAYSTNICGGVVLDRYFPLSSKSQSLSSQVLIILFLLLLRLPTKASA